MSEQAREHWYPDWLNRAETAIAATAEPAILQRSMDFMLRNIKPGMLRKAAAATVKQLVDIIYPPSCIACRRATMNAGTLCAPCWVAMPFIERPYCERLGTPFQQDLGPGLISPEAFANPPVFQRARRRQFPGRPRARSRP